MPLALPYPRAGEGEPDQPVFPPPRTGEGLGVGDLPVYSPVSVSTSS